MICFFARLLLYHEHDNKRIYTYWYHWLALPSSVCKCCWVALYLCKVADEHISLNNRKNIIWSDFIIQIQQMHFSLWWVYLWWILLSFFCARLSSFSVYYQWYQHMLRCWINNRIINKNKAILFNVYRKLIKI